MKNEALVIEIEQEKMLKILKALAHPIRLKIIVDLIKDEAEAERHCTSFGLTISKATRSHHFKLLKEVGLITHVDKGNHSLAKLNRVELQKDHPQLLALIASCK